MEKFDRTILIFIGLGIWALVMSQFLKPSTAVALSNACGLDQNPCSMKNFQTIMGTVPIQVTLGGTVHTLCSITGWTKVTCTSETKTL